MTIIRRNGKLRATFEATTPDEEKAAHWANLVESERELAGFEQEAFLPYHDYVKTLQFIIRHWGMDFATFPTGIQYIVDGIICNRFIADPSIPLRVFHDVEEIASVVLQIVSTSMEPSELVEHVKHETKIEENTVFKYPNLQPERYEKIMERLMKAALKQ